MDITKRKKSILIPYRIREGSISVFLQKHSKEWKLSPDYFGFFGGGKEDGESVEETLRREMKEEIGFIPESYYHFRVYEFERNVKDVFIAEADNNFDGQVVIGEGEYGKWFDEAEALGEQKLIEEDKIVLRDFYKFIHAKT